MANPEHESVFREGKASWTQWRAAHPDVIPDLSRISAASLDLQGWDLRRVDLTDATLNGSNLSGADLSEAKLSRALLFDADLHGARLRKAVARKTNFLSANLDGSDLVGADLVGADMTSATFVGAAMAGVKCETAVLTSANLNRANLASCKFKRANLEEADLTAADLAKGDLRGANLAGANLTGANVHDVRFNRRCRFRGIRLEGAFGSRRFRRFAEDQDYLEEMRSTPLGTVAYWIWFVVADCGRSFLLWIASSTVFCILFALVFERLDVNQQLKIGSQQLAAEGIVGYIELSLRALMGLDVGQMASVSRTIRWWLVGESLVGFVLLGGLVSILMNKVARRA